MAPTSPPRGDFWGAAFVVVPASTPRSTLPDSAEVTAKRSVRRHSPAAVSIPSPPLIVVPPPPPPLGSAPPRAAAESPRATSPPLGSALPPPLRLAWLRAPPPTVRVLLAPRRHASPRRPAVRFALRRSGLRPARSAARTRPAHGRIARCADADCATTSAAYDSTTAPTVVLAPPPTLSSPRRWRGLVGRVSRAQTALCRREVMAPTRSRP